MKKILLLFTVFWLISCEDIPIQEDTTVPGMKPVYQLLDDGVIVESQEARPFHELGKIVSRAEYIYINEKFKGIHVIDNSNPNAPLLKYFWRIEGNLDFTLKDNFLYAENNRDLLTIDISDPANIQLKSTIDNIYLNRNGALAPPEYFGPFECVDPTQGTVVDWEMETLLNPKCRI